MIIFVDSRDIWSKITSIKESLTNLTEAFIQSRYFNDTVSLIRQILQLKLFNICSSESSAPEGSQATEGTEAIEGQFVIFLEAPTSPLIRIGERTMTYLNKDQVLASLS